MKINILVVTIIFAASASAHAQSIEDPYLYYSVGGGRATTPTIIDPSVRYRFRASGQPDSPAAILIQSWISDQCLAGSAIRWQTLDH